MGLLQIDAVELVSFAQLDHALRLHLAGRHVAQRAQRWRDRDANPNVELGAQLHPSLVHLRGLVLKCLEQRVLHLRPGIRELRHERGHEVVGRTRRPALLVAASRCSVASRSATLRSSTVLLSSLRCRFSRHASTLAATAEPAISTPLASAHVLAAVAAHAS
jgi:hypothetical protein